MMTRLSYTYLSIVMKEEHSIHVARSVACSLAVKDLDLDSKFALSFFLFLDFTKTIVQSTSRGLRRVWEMPITYMPFKRL